jgi:phosphate acetyltransferase
MQSPLGFAAMMVRQGDADGTIGGAVATTGETVRTALQIVGMAPDSKIVSSFFLMLLAAPYHWPVVFADCGLVIEPNAAELAEIAIASSTSFTALTGQTPRAAMLSFSTKGSAKAPSIDRTTEALEMVRAKAPSLAIDGELQFDAAFVPDVAARKAPGSPIEGAANVFIFPNLDAGNIGYKIAQRLGGATALGPILQGLAKPANDLSRGCSADDVYQMIAVTGAQAAAQQG